MEKTTILLENGLEISSGPEQTDWAVLSMSLTRSVTAEQALSVGGVCAAMAEIQLMVQEHCPIGQGDHFTLFRGETLLGNFTAQKPRYVSAHRVSVTAYDAVAELDRDISGWWESILANSTTLGELAHRVCSTCGVSLAEEAFPNQDLPVKPFHSTELTGRRVMSWIAQAAGRFCTADGYGNIQFGWYSPKTMLIAPEKSSLRARLEEGNLYLEGLTGQWLGQSLQLDARCQYEDKTLTLESRDQCHYYQGSLTLSDYQTAHIDNVQIRQTSKDVGTIYPDVPWGDTYVIEGNPLLTAEDAQELQPVVRQLYELLSDITYTPCKVTVPAESGLEAGDVVTLQTPNGRQYLLYLMESKTTGNRTQLSCYGPPHRDSLYATNGYTLQALSGKILSLQTDVEGLEVRHEDTAGNVANLSLTLKGLENTVASQSMELGQVRENLTTLTQDSQGLKLQVQTLTEEGVDRVVTSTGYSFSEEGLRISRGGLEMENLLDHTGMQVVRNGQVILQADNRGVKARDVQVENYLILGSHARLEDYGDGTACFYI